MKLSRALLYFLREASVSLVRSWKVSLLAVLTISVSLFIGGTFALLGSNLSQLVERWREESRVVVYLRSDTPPEVRSELAARIAREPWTTAVEEVTPEQAAERFREIFPSLGDLMEGWQEDPLPPSISIAFDPEAGSSPGFETFLDGLRADPAVSLVDDDRDWLRQLATVIALVEGFGYALGTVLLAAAVFTIASVIRLTAYLYRDEIAVMRLVGATEFFIRGPFYVEGLIQGLIGGLMALAGLWSLFLATSRGLESSLLAAMLAPSFLGWQAQAALILLGGAAGLAGAVVSLSRERLGRSEA